MYAFVSTKLIIPRTLLYRLFLTLGLLACCLSISAQPAAQHPTPHANARLLELAATQPTSVVRVIIQKMNHDRTIENQIIHMGGLISTDLPIINGFAARLRADSIPVLAMNDGIRWISLDSPLVKHACTGANCIDPVKLQAAYPQTIGADQVWNSSAQNRGQGIGVAVLDSGVNDSQDLFDNVTWQNRIVARVAYNDGWNQATPDMYGHGNQVAEIIAGNGGQANGAFIGIAPRANIVNVKISDDLNQGTASTSSMIAGMQWIYENHATYNIRVVNISLTDSVIESYHVSALSAAAEMLWFNGIVVVVAAGNGGAGSLAAPANDPFVITVGASDDKATSDPTDDTIASWSSYGTTVDGIAKPDLVAPGVSLTVPLQVPNSYLAQQYPANVTSNANGSKNFTMSGTSMAAPVVSGAIALLLQSQPSLTPDQVKYRLKATARVFGNPTQTGSGELNIKKAIDTKTIMLANQGILISNLNNDGSLASVWSSASTAKWSTAKWSTAKWSTAKWSTAKWSTAVSSQTPPRIKTR